MIDIVAVTYGHNDILKCFINSIKSQTSSNWRLILIHDGPNYELRTNLENENYLSYQNIEFHEYPVRTENYGHLLRKWALKELILNEYVLLTNADNYYTPNMVEEVSKHDEDFIYFDLIHSHKNKKNENNSTYGFMSTELVSSNIDMGCAVIKSSLAKKIGFNHSSYDADWKYFEEVLKTNPTIHKINKVLFVHN